MHSGLGCCPFLGGGSVVIDLLFIVAPIVGFCTCSVFCCALLCVHSSLAISFALFVYLVSGDCCVAVPRGAISLSAVYDCGSS